MSFLEVYAVAEVKRKEEPRKRETKTFKKWEDFKRKTNCWKRKRIWMVHLSVVLSECNIILVHSFSSSQIFFVYFYLYFISFIHLKEHFYGCCFLLFVQMRNWWRDGFEDFVFTQWTVAKCNCEWRNESHREYRVV